MRRDAEVWVLESTVYGSRPRRACAASSTAALSADECAQGIAFRAFGQTVQLLRAVIAT